MTDTFDIAGFVESIVGDVGGDVVANLGPAATAVGGSPTCLLGPSDDSLTPRRVRAMAIRLDGGAGLSVLAGDAIAPRGVRWFRFSVAPG